MAETAPEFGTRWSVGGIVRALAVGALAWAIGSGLGYLVAHESPTETRRTDAIPAASGSGAVRPAQSP
jgi:hypothetical protein